MVQRYFFVAAAVGRARAVVDGDLKRRLRQDGDWKVLRVSSK